jgi:hypothetical protein
VLCCIGLSHCNPADEVQYRPSKCSEAAVGLSWMRRTKKIYPPITVVSSLGGSEPKFDAMGDHLAELSPFGCDADPAF